MKHRDHLSQLDGGLFLTDGGIETTLDDGDPVDLGARYAAMPAKLPNLNVLGGCCGTDHRHVREACEAWRAQASD